MPTREDAPYISSRLMLLFVGFGIVIAVFGFRIYQLTILSGTKYRDMADNNFLLEEPIIAPRGRILDCKGRPLAINQPLFDIEMSPFHLTRQEIATTLDRLATMLNRPKIRKKVDAVKKLYPRWKSLSLLDHNPITLSEVLPVKEQAFDLPGVMVTPQYQRYYPSGTLASFVTGYVGAISKKHEDEFLDKGYLRTEKIGCLGAELTFEALLHGEHGVELVEHDAKGRPRARFTSQPAKPGNVITLTLDMDLQRLADALLEGWNGAIVAIDPRDGSVLAMAARPNFDPNNPTGRGAPKGKYSTYSKITRSGFAPGSTFKIVTATSGLLAGHSPLETINCGGFWELPGGMRFPCNLRSGHDWQNMYEALQHSCNVFFYQWAYKTGADRMIAAATSFGFGERTNFELTTRNEEKPGQVGLPPGKDKIYMGSILHMGIGQGELINVTMIQMARAYSALCNGGTLFRPRIIKDVRSVDGQLIKQGKPEVQGKLTLTDKQREEILEGLRRVVNEQGGTGSHSGIKPEWHVAGKSGTAQTGIPGKPPNAWFVGYAPYEHPTILIVALIEASGHGGDMAAPVVRQLLAQYFGQPEPAIVPPPKTKPSQGVTD